MVVSSQFRCYQSRLREKRCHTLLKWKAQHFKNYFLPLFITIAFFNKLVEKELLWKHFSPSF